jgi:hypothetical protein
MNELLPFEVYERPFVGPAWRPVLMMAALWGVPMTALFVFMTYRTVGVAVPLVAGALGGLAFGFLLTHSSRRRMRRLMRRLYDADPALVPAPPPGPFRCRVACSLMLSGRFAVGGHLYAGPGDWAFVPHKRNLPRHRAPTVLPVSTDLTLTPRASVPSGVVRFLTSAMIQTLELSSGGQTVRLLVPEPQLVAAKLLECAGKSPGTP